MMLTGGSPDARMRSLLSQIRILRGCSISQIGELGRVARILHHDAGQSIVEQGDAPTAVYLVAFGRVRLTVFGENGRDLILADIDAGGFFGDEALSGASMQRATALAIEEVTVLSLPAEAFASFLGTHPRVAFNFGMQLSRQLHAACDSVAALGLLSVEQRLLRALEQLGEQRGTRCPDGLLLRERPTHRELAARVGARRETVTRMLDSLIRRGLVVAHGGTLLVTRGALHAPDSAVWAAPPDGS
jgi:CRP/FNR family transcriptional regulator, cyclic AMP receptor protein